MWLRRGRVCVLYPLAEELYADFFAARDRGDDIPTLAEFEAASGETQA